MDILTKISREMKPGILHELRDFMERHLKSIYKKTFALCLSICQKMGKIVLCEKRRTF
jgi:hypothetical protein